MVTDDHNFARLGAGQREYDATLEDVEHFTRTLSASDDKVKWLERGDIPAPALGFVKMTPEDEKSIQDSGKPAS